MTASSRDSAPDTTPGAKEAVGSDDAPARLTVQDGVAWVRFDQPGKSVNTLSSRFFEWFRDQLGTLEAEDLQGLVFVSDKPDNFMAGADIEELESLADEAAVYDLLSRGHDFLGRLTSSSYPVVAAIHGACLGGGLELSLACNGIVASDHPKTRLGLPEVQIGIFPGLGGTQRLPRRIGVAAALDLILTGKQLDARRARRLGLVDEVCHPADLEKAAAKLLSDLRKGKKRRRVGGMARKLTDLLARIPLLRGVIFARARGAVMKRTGGHYPGPLKAIDVVRQGFSRPLRRALDIEARAFSKLVVSDRAKTLMSIFFMKTGVDGRAAQLAKQSRREVTRVGVLGAGFMGAGVAQVLAYQGYPVLMKDKDHAGVGRGLKHCHDLFQNLVRRRRYRPMDLTLAMSRIQGTTEYSGFRQVDFVVEAVFEDVEVKHRVIRELEQVAPEGLIFASNTSTIPIARLAEASRRPENVVGMHFFSPVHKMPLLEVIRHSATSDTALATTVEVGRRMGKTIIVVNDGPGFFTSRVLAPFLNEAAWCLTQGARIDQIDGALKRWGWPVGAMTLLDEVGLDIAAHAASVVISYLGDRLQPPSVFQRMIDDGRMGRKAGKGFFTYGKGPKRVDDAVYPLLEWQPAKIEDQEIVERCWLQMLNEVARCMEDGVIENPVDVDLGVIFGFGFPPFRGGILREADRMGLDWVTGQLEEYADRYGQRLAPAQLLLDMAAKGERFHKG